MLARLGLLICALATVLAAERPSCEADIEVNCLGDDKDMSPEGINACLVGLTERSQPCSDYLGLLEACAADISGDGVCASSHAEGDTIPCLMERTKPEALSKSCQEKLPKNELTGLAKFWADGKRPLKIGEIVELTMDEKSTYERWEKKKKSKKSEKDRERDYAVKGAKLERAISLITAAGKKAALAGEDVQAVVKAEASKAVDEDMTGTLKPFTKKQLDKIVKDAKAAAKSEL
eukprot:CAMPEP_0174729228 /NCGR_PEP_ID=MMETSP1094-20130205/53310_1 /TAXON_ID=156173 /ORGANISM="Chrysochromulina brevifilum, Strain UTEX LB 985" /LENGTH=233 /DNA_ID=CAMNT_0015931303 /DNA_START=46 /DNA_END=747 /DNA_ORIENTATION=+